MHLIDSDGNVANRFTEGTPGVQPATVVSAAIANAWMQEIASVIQDVGIPLLTSGTDTEDQLLAAIKLLIGSGGISSPVTQSITNNQASAVDVTDFDEVDKTVHKAFEFLYTIERSTDTQDVIETGRAYISWNDHASEWRVNKLGSHDDSGIIFSMVLVSGDSYQLQYQSDDLTGTSYTGELRIIDIKKIKAA